MPPPQGGQQGQGDNSLGPLWIMIGLAVALAGLWFAAHAYIVFAYFEVKLAEIWVVSLFTHQLDQLGQMIKAIPPSQVTFSQLTYVASEVGHYIRIPCALIMAVFAVMVYRSGSASTYTYLYDMDRLAKLEKTNWPQITPIIGLDILAEPIDKGPWAMTTPPMVFAKKNKLIIKEEIPTPEGELQREKKYIARLDRGKANVFFTVQLGGLWSGVERLSVTYKAMFACFAARIAGDRETCDKLLVQFSTSFDNKTGKFDSTGVEQACKKYGGSKVIRLIMKRHAYTLTVMGALLEAARFDGVFASADFLWMRPTDRKLWYMLNTVGRQTAPMEVAGPFAHMIAEKEFGRKIVVPMIEEATNGLELALTEIVYKPDEETAE